MIIGSMTGRELFDIFKKDKPMLEKFAIEKAKKLIRELRKGMGRYTTQCYDFKTKDATEYKVCVFVDRGNIRQFYFDMFIYCKETNDYVCATSLLDEENSAEQFSYTPHFLRRYAERALGIENIAVLMLATIIIWASMILGTRIKNYPKVVSYWLARLFL